MSKIKIKVKQIVSKVLGEDSTSLIEIEKIFSKKDISKKEIGEKMEIIISTYSLKQVEINIFLLIENINEPKIEAKKAKKTKGKTVLKKHQIQKNDDFKKPIVQPMEVTKTNKVTEKTIKEQKKQRLIKYKRAKRNEGRKKIFSAIDNNGHINHELVEKYWHEYRDNFMLASGAENPLSFFA